MHRMLLVVLVILAGCADPALDVRYVATEPGPGGTGSYGGDGTIDMVVAYFSFALQGDGDGVSGDMGAHCGFDDWSLPPATARVHIGSETRPAGIVMREIHPDQSADGVGHIGTAPYALWRPGHEAIGAAFDHERDLGRVAFHGGSASFAGIPVPDDKWLLTDFHYSVEQAGTTWQVRETLHLRYFDDVPVSLDRRELMCD